MYAHGVIGHRIDPSRWTHWAISDFCIYLMMLWVLGILSYFFGSNLFSTTSVTKAMVCTVFVSWGMVHLKDPLLLIRKRSLCGNTRSPISLFEWSLPICLRQLKLSMDFDLWYSVLICILCVIKGLVRSLLTELPILVMWCCFRRKRKFLDWRKTRVMQVTSVFLFSDNFVSVCSWCDGSSVRSFMVTLLSYFSFQPILKWDVLF